MAVYQECCKMYKCLLLLCVLLVTTSADKYVTVSTSSSGGAYTIDKNTGNLYLSYYGNTLGNGDCTFDISIDDSSQVVCVDASSFDIACGTTIEYYDGYLNAASETYTCGRMQYSKWCSTYVHAKIVFKKPYDTMAVENEYVKLRIYGSGYDSDTIEDLHDWALSTVYVIIGIVVGVIVLVIAVIVITVVCCCMRRRRTAGTVYHNQQPAMQMGQLQGSYPTQGPISVVPGGYYTPPQQAGYQPPPQGYNPPQQLSAVGTGYPSTPQQNFAGYQPTSDTKATAPPGGSDIPMQKMEQPPAYNSN